MFNLTQRGIFLSLFFAINACGNPYASNIEIVGQERFVKTTAGDRLNLREFGSMELKNCQGPPAIHYLTGDDSRENLPKIKATIQTKNGLRQLLYRGQYTALLKLVYPVKGGSFISKNYELIPVTIVEGKHTIISCETIPDTTNWRVNVIMTPINLEF